MKERKVRILIVEDDKSIAEAMQLILEIECGYEAIVSGDGDVGLLVLDYDDDFDLIVLDFMMPNMNGELFMEAVAKHQNKKLKKIPILIATAANSGVLGVRDFGRPVLKKPFDIDDFITMVKDTLFTIQVNTGIKKIEKKKTLEQLVEERKSK